MRALRTNGTYLMRKLNASRIHLVKKGDYVLYQYKEGSAKLFCRVAGIKLTHIPGTTVVKNKHLHVVYDLIKCKTGFKFSCDSLGSITFLGTDKPTAEMIYFTEMI